MWLDDVVCISQGHSGGFHCLALLKRVAVTICLHVFVKTYVFSASWEGIVGHVVTRVGLFSHLWCVKPRSLHHSLHVAIMHKGRFGWTQTSRWAVSSFRARGVERRHLVCVASSVNSVVFCLCSYIASFLFHGCF